MSTQRYLATLTEYNHQLVSGLVVEISDGIICNLYNLADYPYETAHTIYLEGILRGNIQVGAAADLYLCDSNNPTIAQYRYPFDFLH
ncbi:MAG: hypothetical protein NC038_07000 [Paludibacter sp.]|nr:hypothetical protein [Bacteroidales bacterium]MCM1069682.1 hypothetical protein [Prevotella sp.]MCM1354328.1 hypothetical protein [Bacteroides sp.]MCM1443133.1 hypothetical protein [Muribaculum sp.]MCM1482368.1 hypothetical protein [Paludibacter sp.]